MKLMCLTPWHRLSPLESGTQWYSGLCDVCKGPWVNLTLSMCPERPGSPRRPNGHQIGSPSRRGLSSLSRRMVSSHLPLLWSRLWEDRALEVDHPTLTDTVKVVSTPTTRTETLFPHTKVGSPVFRSHESVPVPLPLSLKRRGVDVEVSVGTEVYTIQPFLCSLLSVRSR